MIYRSSLKIEQMHLTVFYLRNGSGIIQFMFAGCNNFFYFYCKMCKVEFFLAAFNEIKNTIAIFFATAIAKNQYLCSFLYQAVKIYVPKTKHVVSHILKKIFCSFFRHKLCATTFRFPKQEADEKRTRPLTSSKLHQTPKRTIILLPRDYMATTMC